MEIRMQGMCHNTELHKIENRKSLSRTIQVSYKLQFGMEQSYELAHRLIQLSCCALACVLHVASNNLDLFLANFRETQLTILI